MNLSELFIRRPVLTVLLNAAIVVAGVIACRSIPVAALPSYNTPVINVSAQLPGASPETMASSVALPLEKQFQTIPGLALDQLDQHPRQHLGDARVRARAATSTPPRSTCRRRCCARSAQLPQDMTQPPSYRKVNPADAPVLFIALTSPSLQPVGPERLSPST